MRQAFDVRQRCLILRIQRVNVLIKTLVWSRPAYRLRSGPSQHDPSSFGIPSIHLGQPIPQAEEAGAVSLGPGDGKGDLRRTIEGVAVPGKTVRQDHDAMGFSVPFTDKDGARRGSRASLVELS